MISLLCAHAHPAIPALAAGISLAFYRNAAGELQVSMPVSAHFLARVRAAAQDGALALTDPSPPGLRELEADIMTERDRLLARLEELAAERRQDAPADRAG